MSRASRWHSGQGRCVSHFPSLGCPPEPCGPEDPWQAERRQLVVSDARSRPKSVNTWGDRLPLERLLVDLSSSGRPSVQGMPVNNMPASRRKESRDCEERTANI